MNNINISAAILTKNEEKNIRECMRSLSFCEEVLLVDDYSTDSTRVVAKKLGAKIFRRKLDSDFASQRNFALRNVQGKWVLFVDGDERISSLLRDEIIQLINNSISQYIGFYIKRIDNIWGKELRYGETGNIKLLRLAKRNAGKWRRMVHEYWDVRGKIGVLKNPIIHYPHQTLREFIGDVDYFSTLHAQANQEEGKKSSIFKIIFFPIVKFIDNYFLKLGFQDGVHGFIHALVMSFHSYLSWGKLWILQKKN